ncbi:spermidine synthase [Pseudoteredinibacter isoporae]|uniref:Spermidine synthase n=1 Tax=Pseudoteredinibacter isoporae TaxID=570281 RepID=A0A7X0JSU7_9GAMM|nr:hypothetical protein [Pseudoteredinibacter isoporae]MBB6520686.1 spermidine synthase [Pseudoteredinibacter isoporae]NHO86253.1 hypothetical protein [Pseudoteredinibacter isoporae]NIB25296.1 hypothetical protein [Pseudoteredinibacter isoporae]
MKTLLNELNTDNAEQLWQCNSRFGNLQILENDRYRFLQVDGFIQSVMDLQQADRACLPHAQWLNTALLTKPQSVLMAGLGGGDLIRQFRSAGMASQFSCCELCPDIIRAYRDYFSAGVVGNDVEILQEDINDFIPQCQRQFDLILLDVFTGSAQPACLDEEAFYQHCFGCMESNGVLALNVSVNQQEPLLQLALMLRRVFSKKLLMMPVEGCNNVIMLAFKGRPFANSNKEFVQAVRQLNNKLPNPVPVQLERLLGSNVCDERGELALWHLP